MNKEDYKKIEELFNKMPESDKNKLKEFILNHKEEFQADPVETARKGLEEIFKQAIEQFTNYVNDEIEKASSPEPIDYAKTFNDQPRVERESMYIDKKNDPNLESIPVNNYVEPIRGTDNNISDNKIADYNELSSIKKEEHLEKIVDPIKYEEIKHRQAELEEEIKKSVEELPEEAKYSIDRLKEYRRMMATQVNPKVLTDESLITAKYLHTLDKLLLSKIKEQAALAKQTTTLGHNLTSREQGYVNYYDLLYYSKLEDLSLVYAMFYVEFPSESFGEYAKEKLEEMKQQENQKPRMMKINK